MFGDLDRLAPEDAILASNSSSYPTSQLIDAVSRPGRVVNTHYYRGLPELNVVEVMSCGKTTDEVIARLFERLPTYGLLPFHVRKESVGFIFNRICAANCRSTRRRPGVLRACCRYSNLSRHAQSHRDNRRDHCCWSLRSCGRYAVGNSSGYRERGPTRDYRQGWSVSRKARGYRYHRLRQD